MEVNKFEVITNNVGKTIYVKSDKKVEYYQYNNDGNLSCKTIIRNTAPTETYYERYVLNSNTREYTAYYSRYGQEEVEHNKLISKYTSPHEVYKKYENAAERTIFYDNTNTDKAITIYKHVKTDFISIDIYFKNKAYFKDIIVNFIYPVEDKDFLSNTIPEIDDIYVNKVVLCSVSILEKNNEFNIQKIYIGNGKKDITMSEFIMSDSIKGIKDIIVSNCNNIGNKLIIDDDMSLIKKLSLSEIHMTNANDEHQYSYISYDPNNGKIIKTITSIKTSEENNNGYTKSYYEETTVIL